VLLSRLTVVAAASLVVTACAGADGTDGGAIQENVIEPGITAIDESDTVACGSEASSFRTALEAYEIVEGEPAADEQALIDAGLLREESELWDVTDGRLVAQNPDCGTVPATVPATEIVTDTGSVPTVEDVLATLTAEDIALIGGADCARQLAVVVAGAARYAEREGVDPETFADAENDFEEPVTLWQLVDDALRPADGSGCVDFAAAGSG
jgi:hypothetical protein